MTSEYIARFVLQETDEARAGKGRIVSAIRTFLRFLFCDGTDPAQLIRAIPRVRSWQYADLRKHLSASELNLALKACQSDQYGSL
jgi:hypothetical protein